MKIFTINNKKEEKFLRRKTQVFDFSTNSTLQQIQGRPEQSRGATSSGQKFSKKEIRELIKEMREIMKEADGVGLSANQVGIDLQLFAVQMPQISQSEPTSYKFFAIFNPQIVKFSKEKILIEEGCLSVPGIWGGVERPEKITLVGFDKNGKKLKIKAWGLLARIFQHEIDHLNGILFIDKAKQVYKIPASKQKVL